jgi:hypothetical protein
MKQTLKQHMEIDPELMHPEDLKSEKYLKEQEKHETEKGSLVELKGFDKEKGSILNYEQMRVFLKDLDDRLGNSGFNKFLENYCQISLNTLATQEQQEENAVRINSSGNKLNIELNPLSFVEYGKTTYEDENGKTVKLQYFNPAKAAFLLGRVVGSLINEPDNWNEIKNKIDFVKNSDATEWEDFVGLCIVSPEEARKISKHGYEHFTKILNRTVIDASTIKMDKKWKSPDFSFGEQITENKKDKKGFLGKIDGAHWLNWKFITSFSNSKLKSAFSVVDKLKLSFTYLKEALWTKSSWYEITVAEFEDKEAGRILVQNIGIGERDKSMRYLTVSSSSADEFRLRTLLIADMKSGDFGRWRIHAYLETRDSTYRKTKGKQINPDSYNFLMRLHRLSYGAKRFGSEVMEYSAIEAGKEYTDENGIKREATSEIYIRKSDDTVMEETLSRISTISTRNMANGLDKEIFEYMKIGDRFTGVDEKYTKENESSTTGDMSNLVGKGFYESLITNMDNGNGCSKLNPDQIAILARYYADQEASENKNIYGDGEKGILNEYTPAIAKAAFNNYKEAFSKPPYRKYVEYFLNQKKSEQLNGGLTEDEQEDRNKLKNFVGKELKTESDKKALGNALEESNKIGAIDPDGINIETSSKEEVAKSYQNIKSGESILKEKGIDPIVKKSKLSKAVMDYLKKALEESYDKGELFTQEDVFKQFEKDKIDLTIEDKREIQNILLDTRAFRREIIRLRGSLKKLGIEPYLEKVRESAGFTSESLKTHNLFKDKLDIITEYLNLGRSQDKIAHDIVESIKNSNDLKSFFKEDDLNKCKNVKDITALIQRADSELPRKIDIDAEKKKIIDLERECAAFNSAAADEKDTGFDNGLDPRKVKLLNIGLIPQEQASKIVNDAEALDMLKRAEIALLINEAKPVEKKAEETPVKEENNNKSDSSDE